MAQSLNKVQIIGNLGADPEIRSTPNGAQVANFRIACAESWKDQSGQKQERTEWVTCVAWKVTAEIVEKYVRKGSKVYVEGKLQTRTWEDKNGGGKRYATEVLVERIMMLDGRRGGGDYGQRDDEPRGAAARPDLTPPPDDDLPFS
jgi:single-strand DNA-binding protein